jgi:hypothetical protein
MPREGYAEVRLSGVAGSSQGVRKGNPPVEGASFDWGIEGWMRSCLRAEVSRLRGEFEGVAGE